ncbi:MAG TPA: preprotein translocase subunit YajC [Gaiellaceae bacterium]|nr:preprotein translocase subunit YajC [Gaiellaceae bacterium]
MDSGFILFFVLMLAVLYFLLIRPQRQQARRHQDMLSSLKVGDEVVTAGGIYGEVTAIDDERVQLEIDADVKIAVSRRAIASVVPPEESEHAEESEPAEEYEGVTADEPEPVSEEKAHR